MPTDEEWKEVEMYLEMSQSEADVEGWRGTDEGGKLKESGFSHWESPNTSATNESGFSALPSGYRSYGDGNFTDKGYDGSWWSINERSQTSAIYRSVGNNLSDIFRTTNNKLHGFSIRCIMD